MTTPVHTSLLTPVLRWLPHRLLAALDGWSYRIAQRRAEQRREAGRRLQILKQQRAGS